MAVTQFDEIRYSNSTLFVIYFLFQIGGNWEVGGRYNVDRALLLPQIESQIAREGMGPQKC